jgi:hypothetical protein
MHLASTKKEVHTNTLFVYLRNTEHLNRLRDGNSCSCNGGDCCRHTCRGQNCNLPEEDQELT